MSAAPMNWTPAAKARLIHLHSKGMSYKDIAAALGATTWACSQRISLLRKEGTVIAYRQAGGGRRAGSGGSRPVLPCQPPIETDDDEDVGAAEACDGHLADLQRDGRLRWITEARA